MKTKIVTTLATLLLATAFSGCTTVVEEPRTTSTTTTESTVRTPVSGSTTETRTMRSY